MTRVEENRATLEEMNRLVNASPASTCEEMTMYQLSAIGVALIDMSKSLAVLADKVNSDGLVRDRK